MSVCVGVCACTRALVCACEPFICLRDSAERCPGAALTEAGTVLRLLPLPGQMARGRGGGGAGLEGRSERRRSPQWCAKVATTSSSSTPNPSIPRATNIWRAPAVGSTPPSLYPLISTPSPFLHFSNPSSFQPSISPTLHSSISPPLHPFTPPSLLHSHLHLSTPQLLHTSTLSSPIPPHLHLCISPSLHTSIPPSSLWEQLGSWTDVLPGLIMV